VCREAVVWYGWRQGGEPDCANFALATLQKKVSLMPWYGEVGTCFFPFSNLNIIHIEISSIVFARYLEFESNINRILPYFKNSFLYPLDSVMSPALYPRADCKYIDTTLDIPTIIYRGLVPI